MCMPAAARATSAGISGCTQLDGDAVHADWDVQLECHECGDDATYRIHWVTRLRKSNVAHIDARHWALWSVCQRVCTHRP